jgi:hydrogenase maturation protease
MTIKPGESRLMELLARAQAGGQPIVLLGIGNEFRGDDAIGHLVAQGLAELELPGLRAFPVGIALENATHLVARHQAQVLLLVDAVSDLELPLGTWGFFEPEALGCFIHSTHSVPLSLFVSYWRKEIPGLEVHFIGVNIHGTATFKEVSPAILATRQALLEAFRNGLSCQPPTSVIMEGNRSKGLP